MTNVMHFKCENNIKSLKNILNYDIDKKDIIISIDVRLLINKNVKCNYVLDIIKNKTNNLVLNIISENKQPWLVSHNYVSYIGLCESSGVYMGLQAQLNSNLTQYKNIINL